MSINFKIPNVDTKGPVEIKKHDGSSVTAYPTSILPEPVKNHTSGESGKPVYASKYSDKIPDLIDAISGYGSFSYDAESDPLFSGYKKQYLREGKRAIEDTMGSFAGMTGGIPSSYAVTAASQAGNYYNSQLTDKIPQLYDIAYNKYRDDYANMYKLLNMYLTADETDYGRYRDDVDDWYADREFQTDINKYSDDLARNDRDFQYKVNTYSDEKAANEKAEALKLAETAAKYGDYSYYNNLGVDTSEHQNRDAYDRAYNYAMDQAANGNFKPAEELGLDVTELKRLWSLGILTEEQALRNAGYTGDVRADSNAFAASLLPAPVNDNGSDKGVGTENGVTDNAIVKYDNISGNYYNAAGQVVGNDGKVRYYADANTSYIFDKDGNIATYSQYSDPNAVIIWPEMLEKNATIGDNGGRQSAVTPIPDGYQYGDAFGSGTPTNYVPAVEESGDYTSGTPTNYVPAVEEEYEKKTPDSIAGTWNLHMSRYASMKNYDEVESFCDELFENGGFDENLKGFLKEAKSQGIIDSYDYVKLYVKYEKK